MPDQRTCSGAARVDVGTSEGVGTVGPGEMAGELSLIQARPHRATVTEAQLSYEGSLTVDRDLLDAVDLAPNEQVHIANLSNGERFVTDPATPLEKGDSLLILSADAGG